jgi:hypothetical protein
MAGRKKTLEEKRISRRKREIRNRNKKPHLRWLIALKNRANAKGLEFNLTKEDLVIPEYCPVLGIKLARATGRVTVNSPQVDRINNNRGYVKGNVRVVSQRANTLKRDATIEELIDVILYMVEHEKNNNEKI